MRLECFQKYMRIFSYRGSTWTCHGVTICLTCCSFEHPGVIGAHVGVHGRRPWWVRLERSGPNPQGPWCRYERGGKLGFFELLEIADALATCREDVLALLELDAADLTLPDPPPGYWPDIM